MQTFNVQSLALRLRELIVTLWSYHKFCWQWWNYVSVGWYHGYTCAVWRRRAATLLVALDNARMKHRLNNNWLLRSEATIQCWMHVTLRSTSYSFVWASSQDMFCDITMTTAGTSSSFWCSWASAVKPVFSDPPHAMVKPKVVLL